MHKSFALSFVVLCGALAVSGCGGSKYVAVEGTVTLDGQPIEGALVNFAAADGTVASGITSPSGKFKLLTAGNEGVPAGTYKVTVTKLENKAKDVQTQGRDPTDAYKDYMKANGGMTAVGGKKPQIEKPKSEIPERYSKNGGLPDQIVPPASAITIELSSKK